MWRDGFRCKAAGRVLNCTLFVRKVELHEHYLSSQYPTLPASWKDPTPPRLLLADAIVCDSDGALVEVGTMIAAIEGDDA